MSVVCAPNPASNSERENGGGGKGNGKVVFRGEGIRIHLPDKEGSEEVFVHYTDVEGEGFRSLTEGERVSYEAAMSTRGARTREEAKNVQQVE